MNLVVVTEESLIWKCTRGSGEHMVDGSVYQIQVSWASMKEHSSVKVPSWELVRA